VGVALGDRSQNGALLTSLGGKTKGKAGRIANQRREGPSRELRNKGKTKEG